jgi:hypothetical protein
MVKVGDNIAEGPYAPQPPYPSARVAAAGPKTGMVVVRALVPCRLHSGFPPKFINVSERCAGKKVVIVGLPGKDGLRLNSCWETVVGVRACEQACGCAHARVLVCACAVRRPLLSRITGHA